EIRQLEVVEEDLHELVARQREDERVLAVALARLPLVAAAAAALRARDVVAGDELAVAGQHEFAIAAVAEAERRFGNVLLRHADLAALLHVGELALADHLLDGVLDMRLITAQEALAIDRASAAAARSTVDQ